MRLNILAIGRDRSGLFAPAVGEYLKRLKHYAKVELIELPEAKKTAGTPRAKDEEGETVLRRLEPGSHLVVLDERGKEQTSIELAERLGALLRAGRDVSFVIGGSDGLSSDLLARAQESWSLSRFTLAHRLARLVLMEQLYRAFTLLRGEPYHK